jgi:hypothetical protein
MEGEGRQHIDGGWLPSLFITLLLVHQTNLFINDPNPPFVLLVRIRVS